MMEIQTRASFDPLEDWVPELAGILERYRENEQASMMVTTRLIEMGLVRLVSQPDRPGELMLDSRILQQAPEPLRSQGYHVVRLSGRLRDAGRDLDSPIVGAGLSRSGPRGRIGKPPRVVRSG